MSRQKQIPTGWLVLLAVLLQACAVKSPYEEVSDPLEGMNRVIYRFNDTLDRNLVKPVAEYYKEYVPSPVRNGVGNFFDNIYEPIVIVNDLLQWKPEQAASDTMRFGFNTVFGVAGLIDVATPWGLEKHHEDFGQTFGVWGFGEGWYFVWPLLGPSTMRDTAGLPPAWAMEPVNMRTNGWVRLGWYSLFTVNLRAELLSATSVLDAGSVDAYLQVRTAYRQKRWYDIHDGDPPEPDFFNDELFSD
jgi:phospholipid-binding lipoprotein MlaA